MFTFKQFVENRDREELKDYGINPNRMQIYKARKPGKLGKPSIEKLRKLKFLKVVVPPEVSNAPERVMRFNNQIVAVTPSSYGFGHGNVITVEPLSGRQSEGMFVNIPYEYLEVPSKEEIKHGEWLSNSFFHRTEYVPHGDKRTSIKYINTSSLPENHQKVLLDALAELRNHRDPKYQGMANNLHDEFSVDLWLIAADMLDEIEYDTSELRAILNSIK